MTHHRQLQTHARTHMHTHKQPHIIIIHAHEQTSSVSLSTTITSALAAGTSAPGGSSCVEPSEEKEPDAEDDAPKLPTFCRALCVRKYKVEGPTERACLSCSDYTLGGCHNNQSDLA